MPRLRNRPGLGVDSSGGPVVDPTENVLQLVEAANRRQDDLRNLTATWQERFADMRHRFIEQLATLRAAHTAEMRHVETQRLDAIRAVDQGNVATQASVQTQAAAALANQVAAAADAMRTQVETTRQQLQAQIAATNEPLLKDVAELRKVQYETAGQRSQVLDTRDVDAARVVPWLAGFAVIAVAGAAIMQQLGALRRNQDIARGQQAQVVETRQRGLSTQAWVVVGLSIVGLVLTLVSIVVVAAVATHGFR